MAKPAVREKTTAPARRPAPTPGPAAGTRRVEAALRAQQALIAAGTTRLGQSTADDIHDARVAARRLRSLLRTYRPLLQERRARLYRVDLRSYARALGGVREADVRRDLLVAIGRREPTVTPVEFRRLCAILEAGCLGARDQLRRQMQEPGWAALCRALEREVADERPLVLGEADLDGVLGRVEKTWRRAVPLLEAEPDDPQQLHELRLALKHCRYALESVADVAPKASARLLRRLRSAQDRIGEHRDTVLARKWVHGQQRPLGKRLASRLERLLERRDEALIRRAVRSGRKVLPEYRAWRKACAKIRREASRGRG